MAAVAKFPPWIRRWGLGLAVMAWANLSSLRASDLPPECPRSVAVQDRPELARLLQPSLQSPGGEADYRDQIQTTVAGSPRLSHWCVWIEPGSREQRWQPAIGAALSRWQQVLPIDQVPNSDQAQVLVLHRRPPLVYREGRQRASHGRTTLTARYVDRGGQWRLEPSLVVMVDSTQRQEGIQATALHELGHAFGLWGHSLNQGDVMAASPGARPLLQLSPRDLATLNWLYHQPTTYGRPWTAAPAP